MGVWFAYGIGDHLQHGQSAETARCGTISAGLGDRFLGEVAASMELNINGSRRTVRSSGDRALLYVLRDELDLTGTKYGCGEGQCGACTVLVDGVATRSCLLATRDAVGKAITTIEGLAKDEQLHPVQDAFLAADALQCGYCTSGMIMASVGLLHKTPNPSEDEIRHGMQGNVCRCGTYPRIIQAVQMAARQMQKGGSRG